MLITVTLVVLVILIILLAKIQIDIEYKRLKEDDRLEITLRFLKIKIYEAKLSLIDISKNENEFGFRVISNLMKKKSDGERKGFIDFKTILEIYEDIRKYYHLYKKSISHIIDSLKRTLTAEQFRTKVEFGSFDPAITGMSVGVLYAVLWNFFCYISYSIRIKKHEILVIPNFKQDIFKLDVFCIFTIRTGNIIYVGLRILLVLLAHKILNSKKENNAGLNLNIN